MLVGWKMTEGERMTAEEVERMMLSCRWYVSGAEGRVMIVER